MINWGARRRIGRLDGGSNGHDGSRRNTVVASPRASQAYARVTDRVAVALVVAFGLVVPAAARVSAQAANVGVYTMTPGRMAASSAAVTALIGVVLGGLALARAGRRRGTGDARRGIIASLVLGSIGVIVGAVVVATADGGLGTGGGLAGGIVAMMLGLIGMALAGLASARSRRAA